MVLFALTSALAVGAAVAVAPIGTAGAAYSSERFADVPESTAQVIEVAATSWRTSYAYLRLWRRTSGGDWTTVTGTPARLGTNGLVPRRSRRQNTSTTPAGTFALGPAFGIGRAPSGTRLTYRPVTNEDYWVYDPADPRTYNRWVTGRSKDDTWRLTEAERLVEYGRQYRFAVIIDYNHAVGPGRPDTRAGGGIFLHVKDGGATSGCVSISRSKMARVLRWLDPGKDPRIGIGVRR